MAFHKLHLFVYTRIIIIVFVTVITTHNIFDDDNESIINFNFRLLVILEFLIFIYILILQFSNIIILILKHLFNSLLVYTCKIPITLIYYNEY
jgi:hypothetical protein